MPYSVTPTLGIDLDAVYPADGSQADGNQPPHALGQQVWGDDGLRYVFAGAGEAIPASTAVSSIDPVTFIATATAGTYTSPATDLVAGDSAWFSAPSV